MNTLAWLASLPAVLWLADYAFNTLSETSLGVAALIAFAFCLAQVVLAALDDLDIARGRKRS